MLSSTTPSPHYSSSNNRNEQTSNFRNIIKGEAIAGVVSSWVSVTALCPFDVLKTRLQAQPHSQSMARVSKLMFQNEGFIAFWRGLGPSMLLAVPSKAVYFPCYRTIKNSLDHQLPTTSPLIAGMTARSMTALITCPIEYVRTNAQASTAGTPVYAQAFNGPPSRLWTGVGAMILRDAPFSALLWFGYETLNPKLSNIMPYPSLANLTAGSIAGVFGATLTIPFDVIKTRSQAAIGSQRSFRSTFNLIMATDGTRGLFRGLTPRLLKIAPGFGLMMLVYEQTRTFIQNNSHFNSFNQKSAFSKSPSSSSSSPTNLT
eukprot:gb/GECH01014613.1/.p1 GENE.gb/GECH01014613.1/~~gb/GECH01014613.1/.p1  ORF type:complete len:316 (+),score=49.14 gb/GECH01014613.1/:1-948(+)